MFTHITQSPYGTVKLASKVAQRVREGTVICLEGGLGAGKTLFVQSMARTLGVQGEVTSPTFNIFNIYCGSKGKLYHFDLYRISDPDELFEIGFEDFISDGEAISVIEWPDIAKGSLPGNCIEVSINADGRNRYFDFREDNEFERKIKTIESIEDEYAVN